MKLVFRILIIPALVWAIFIPTGNLIFFGQAMNPWILVVHLSVVVCGMVLALATYTKTPSFIWSLCFLLVLAAALAGRLYHFKDSGESGPLPFEWLNGYLFQSFPLLLLAGAHKAWLNFLVVEQPPAP